MSSEFTLRERARFSLRFNGQYYFVYMLVGISVVIALAIKLGSWDIYVVKAFGQAFSNTIGLFLCMIFLGYGLVELPRSLWRQANYLAFLRQVRPILLLIVLFPRPRPDSFIPVRFCGSARAWRAR
jgi:hypothetical protein